MTATSTTPSATSTPDLLDPAALAAALAVPDLSGPATAAGAAHALSLLVPLATGALATAWGVPVRTVRTHPLVPVEDNYDRLGYAPDAVTRDARYTRYASETCVLRSHTSAGVPYALRHLAAEADAAPDDVLLALPGLVHRRDAIDRLHTGTPHQMDLWRVRRTEPPLVVPDLLDMVGRLVETLLPGRAWRTTPAVHPYTTEGVQVDVREDGTWVEVAECGLAAQPVLERAGLVGWTGLALGMGLDRMLMLRKGLPDIRLLRSTDPRVAGQLHDLSPYRPVSSQPPVRRDLSIALRPPVDVESLGDRVREALGPEASSVELVDLRSQTAYEDLPSAARDRIGLRPGQVNALVRLVLRPLDRTLTDADANDLRDRVYAALHEGSAGQWVAEPSRRHGAGGSRRRDSNP